MMICKAEKAEYDRQRYQSHKIEILEKHREYRRSHKVEIAKQRLIYDQTSIRKEAGKKRREKHPEKGKAVDAVNRAVKVGELIRSPFCEECGLPAETEGHHNDYFKPLKIIWLCVPCHTKLHKILREEIVAC